MPCGDQPFEHERDVKMACVQQMVQGSFGEAERAGEEALGVLKLNASSARNNGK